MPLYLFEVVSHQADQNAISALLADIDHRVGQVPAEVVEFQVTASGSRIFVGTAMRPFASRLICVAP